MPAPAPHDEVLRAARTGMRISGAVSLVLTSIVAAVLIPLIIGRMSSVIADPDKYGHTPPALVLLLVGFRWALPLLPLPSFICGLALLRRGRARRRSWPLLALGMMWLVGLLALVLIAMISMLAPLYTYQPPG